MIQIRSRPVMGLLVSVFLLGLAAPAMAADEKAKAAKPAAEEKSKAPAGVPVPKVLVENDKVRVVETRIKPGEGTPSRELPPRVTRALTSGTMERTYPDGKKEKVEWKAGDTKYFPKETFANKNVGKTELVLYSVNLK
jgi:hypothetical protein